MPAKRPGALEAAVGEFAGDAMDYADLQRFGRVEVEQYATQAF